MRYTELYEGSQTFQLPPGFDPAKYVMTGGLRNCFEQWRAPIIAANNVPGDKKIKKGDLDNVGYVWISTKDNTIIPIARCDEHNLGGDMVYDYVRKNRLELDPRDYVPCAYPVSAGSPNILGSGTGFRF